jgi:hypothetical protein
VAQFERTGTCRECGREYLVKGTAANPGAETEAPSLLPCACGGSLSTFLPGSTNRDRLELRPLPQPVSRRPRLP